MQDTLQGICLTGAMVLTVTAAAQIPTPAPKVVELGTHGRDYRPVLNGPPETAGMRS